MKNDYKTIKPMKGIPDQLRKLRRQFLRYQQAEIVYSLSHKKLLELASDAGAISASVGRTNLTLTFPGWVKLKVRSVPLRDAENFFSFMETN